MNQVFSFWINMISKCVSWLFTLKINSNPNITLGEFILAFAFIGIVLYFILGTDFIPGLGFTKNIGTNNNSNDNYKPRHAPGNAGQDYSTRESRHKY
ncbi:MAG: hypothetical protein IJY25_03105 [Bacilli bacterium]|nr:hypothetical protein [Bacilli bacterium]